MDPTRAENFLTPRPEAFPKTLIHAANKPKRTAFESAQYRKLFGGRFGKRGLFCGVGGMPGGSCLNWICQLTIAAWPPYGAESLWLSVWCSYQLDFGLRPQSTEKYFASGWWTMIAEVDCSGSSWNSSVSSTPIRAGSSNS